MWEPDADSADSLDCGPCTPSSGPAGPRWPRARCCASLGWYGVSGERYAERQLPYLASCTVPGAALIIAGRGPARPRPEALAAARVEELYGLLVAAEPADAEAPRHAAADAPRGRQRPTC